MVFPAVKSTRRSMLGRRNSSFGHALFKLRKSTQHRIWPFFFFMGTILENHLGCWISLMNPVVNSFLTLLVFWAFTSVWKTLVGWTTDLTPGSTLREWTTSLRSRPGISSFFHTNTSTYLLSNPTNYSFSYVVSRLLITTSFGGPRSTPKLTFSSSSSGWICTSFSGSSKISS